MKQRAEYYATKYGINIHVVKIDAVSVVIKSIVMGDSSKSEVVIVYRDGTYHASPILIHKSLTKEAWTIAIMDCADSEIMCKDVLTNLSGSIPDGVNVMISKGARLADSYSCRVESLMLGKYALLWAKNKGDCHLPDLLKNSAKEIESYCRPVLVFCVPRTWAVGAQVVSRLPIPEGMKGDIVNHKGETFEDWKKRHHYKARVKVEIVNCRTKERISREYDKDQMRLHLVYKVSGFVKESSNLTFVRFD
ncbi:MAG: hypothetical protein P0S95_07290 [Rhabdochlamydiaceae bacterium]|nr:hypothetical protein [Candidatus Amphrikana amoebophyrae]